jgi:Clostripain family
MAIESFSQSDTASRASAESSTSLREEWQTSLVPPKRATWTIAVDLTTTQDSSVPIAGAERQNNVMKRLQDETRGKPVTFVVQTLHDQTGRGDRELERYVIRDGAILPLDDKSVASRGASADLQGLLHVAENVSPSDRIGLVIQSHGGAARGLQSDAGSITIPELKGAIRSGLEGSGHHRLDILDFDSCSMSSLHVLDQLKNVAGTMVASAEPEHAFGNSDAQNLTAIARDLLAHPNLTGQQLGNDIVNLAASGANNNTAAGMFQGKSATPDLGSFNLDNMGRFTNALNDFGSALQNSFGNAANRNEINRLIHKTPAFSREGRDQDGVGDQERDIGMFAESIQSSIRSGRLLDRDGRLMTSTNNILQELHGLMPAHFGEALSGKPASRGLSAFLPDAELRDIDARASQFSTLGRLNSFTHDSKLARFGKSFLSDNVKETVKTIENQLGPGVSPELAPLERANNLLIQATNEQDYNRAIQQVRTEIGRLNGGEIGHALTVLEATSLRQIEEKEFQNHPQPAPAWNQFMQSLQANPGTFK